jgi:6-pyruvoyltetrahydropterin/6-carboxytetrahydropterin synthase
MLETFVEFTFEAAHQIPPFSTLHGHSFRVVVFMVGEPDPVFGWSHNLYDVAAVLEDTKRCLHDCYLNDIEGLEVPSLENIAVWIWNRLDKSLPGLDRVVVRRGMEGSGEGCSYQGRPARSAA